MSKELSIIIPTFNEAKNISILIKDIDTTLRGKIDYEIIVADDDSPDRTWEVAKNLTKEYPVSVLRRMKNKGLSPAVVEGFSHATGKIIGVMDADFSHPPKYILKFMNAFNNPEIDIVWGSRLVEGGGVEEWPIMRKVISEVARLFVRPLTSIKDTMSGYFFFRAPILEGVELKPRGYKIGLEIVVRCPHKKAVEIPYIFRNREVGYSKLSTKIYIQYLIQVLILYWSKLVK